MFPCYTSLDHLIKNGDLTVRDLLRVEKDLANIISTNCAE